MSEPKFTKGPWKLFSEKGDIVSTKTGDLIVKWDAYHTEEQQLADSALIAAAPEMYALLLDILTDYQCMPNPAVMAGKIEAVLKKARGEE
jgi:hypothetical protein